MLKKPAVIFILLFVIISCVLLFFRIRLFDGEVVLNYGGVRRVEGVKMALGEALGIGVTKEEMQNVESVSLNITGYVLAFLVTIGLPVLIAYRVKLTQDNRRREEQRSDN